MAIIEYGLQHVTASKFDTTFLVENMSSGRLLLNPISHLSLGLSSGLFHSGTPTKNIWEFVRYPMWVKCFLHHILHHLIVLIILWCDAWKPKSPHLLSGVSCRNFLGNGHWITSVPTVTNTPATVTSETPRENSLSRCLLFGTPITYFKEITRDQTQELRLRKHETWLSQEELSRRLRQVMISSGQMTQKTEDSVRRAEKL
jgi:hypothetical protein